MTVLEAPYLRDSEPGRLGPRAFVLCGVAAAILAPVVAFSGYYDLAFLAAVAIAIAALVSIRPQYGAYLYLLATPLIVGIARGDLLSILRPNEALIAVIMLGLGMRAAVIMLQGRRYALKFDRVDLSFILLALCASVLPLALRWGRAAPISSDDVFYALVLWKYYLVYRIFRESISTPEQVATCLWLSMAAACAVGIVALLQVNNLLGVPQFLYAYYDNPFQNQSQVVTERGTSTIASSFGVADLMIMNLALVMTMLSRAHSRRLLLTALGCIFLLGCVAAGQFSGLVGLAIMAVTVGLQVGRLRQVMLLSIPLVCIAALLLWPVLADRLSGFESVAGLPSSWLSRLENLQRFFLGELGNGLNWLTGVRPAARVAAPEPWRTWVYIESGYLWLLWTGGLPFVAAFIAFVLIAHRKLKQVIQGRIDPMAVAATAAWAWIVTMIVLMALDPHLTMRGAADLFFPLLALSFAGGSDDLKGKNAIGVQSAHAG